MARLTTKARKKLPKSEFAIPSERAYPVNDASHARNALARVSQLGTPAEKAEVRRKVHQEYPSMGEKGKSSERARMMAKERTETPAQEAKESPADQRKEARTGVERDGHASHLNRMMGDLSRKRHGHAG